MYVDETVLNFNGDRENRIRNMGKMKPWKQQFAFWTICGFTAISLKIEEANICGRFAHNEYFDLIGSWDLWNERRKS